MAVVEAVLGGARLSSSPSPSLTLGTGSGRVFFSRLARSKRCLNVGPGAGCWSSNEASAFPPPSPFLSSVDEDRLFFS